MGGFLAVFGAAAPAGAATESFALSSASLPGQSSVGWQVGLGNPPATPNVWPDPITLSGQIDPTTGNISGATLSLPPMTQPPTEGETPTFTFSEINPGTATGTYTASTGAVTLNDTLRLAFNIEPLNFTCDSSPITVALSGTYDPTSENVTLSASGFTIPQFPDAYSLPTCSGGVSGSVLAGINASPGGIAGSVGNAMSLALHGQFAPGLPTTTTLATTPPTPQLAGTSVTLTATVTDPSGTGTPAGNVNFLNNGAYIGTGALSAGTGSSSTATLKTSTLPGGTNQLSATYTGSPTYAASTSSVTPYAIEPPPAVTANLPTSVTAGGAPTPFSVTVTNPASGQNYADTFVQIYTDGNLYLDGDYPTISYQDTAGNWCPLTDEGGGTWYYSGAGTPPCGKPPSSIALNAGDTLTIPMEISYPAVSGSDVVQVGLVTGSCPSGPASCTGVAPFAEPNYAGGTGPGFSTNINVLSASGIGTVATTINLGTGRLPTTTVRQGFDVMFPITEVIAPENYPANPTGSLQYFVDGQLAGTEQLSTTITRGSSYGSETGAELFYDTANLAPGTHTVLINYSGDQLFAPNSLTETFMVVAGPPTGTAFTCSVSNNEGINPLPFSAYVTATAYGIPSTAVVGTTVNASEISVTLDLDGATYGYANSFNADQQPATIDFVPSGSATAGPITFNGTNTSTDNVGTWSGMSASIPITGTPGTVVPLGPTSISFTWGLGGGTVNCTAVAGPATLASVTVSGNTLVASPSGSATAGTPVTLTDTVSPTPPGGTTAGTWGQVDFYDGTTDLGTVPVTTFGTAAFTTANLAVGDHQLTAVWNGNGNVGPNTSNTVNYTVGTATTTASASSANPANAANPVTYTATVSPPPGATTQPTGDVSFAQDGNPISTCQNVALSMASPPAATCAVTYGPGESHSIVAAYSGDGTYLSSASGPLTQTTLPGTTTTVISTKDPSPPGNVTFWAGVGPSSGTGATPTGTVAFTIDGKPYSACATQPLGSGGGASCTVSFKANTTHKVYAVYPGSASYSGSTSSTIVQTVTGSSSSTKPKTTTATATLASGKTLGSGQSLAAGNYRLTMQADGNLVELQGSKALWSSRTSGHPGTAVVMQKNGNLVEYSHGKAIWSSKTAGHSGAHLTLQGADGNVVIYTTANNAVWATGT